MSNAGACDLIMLGRRTIALKAIACYEIDCALCGLKAEQLGLRMLAGGASALECVSLLNCVKLVFGGFGVVGGCVVVGFVWVVLCFVYFGVFGGAHSVSGVGCCFGVCVKWCLLLPVSY